MIWFVLVITAFTLAIAARVAGVVRWPGAVVIVTSPYMLGVGLTFTTEGARRCLVPIGPSTSGYSSDPRPRTAEPNIQVCPRYAPDTVMLAFGAGMIVTFLIGAVVLLTANKRRIGRPAVMVAAVFSLSGMGFSYTPTGFVAGAFSALFLALAAIHGWELRPRRENA